MISLVSDLILMTDGKLGTMGPISSSGWWHLICSIVNPGHSQNMHQGLRNPKAIFKIMKVLKQCVFLSFSCLLPFFFIYLIVRGVWESKFFFLLYITWLQKLGL